MPNVLKVYLENGQTKAFKFEAHTTVKVFGINLNLFPSENLLAPRTPGAACQAATLVISQPPWSDHLQ